MDNNKSGKIVLLFTVIAILMGFLIMPNVIKAANIVGGNYKNVTVHTSVNITNAKPIILNMFIYQDGNTSIQNITLNAGLTRPITCNITVRDYNGYTDITNVNATLWDTLNSVAYTTDDNNTHYTNTNCTNTGNGNGYDVNYLCNFSIYYYANNGTWNCTAVAIDTYNKTGNITNTTVIRPLYALNVTDGINYGNVQVEDYSAEIQANVTNFGNLAINISLEGFAQTRGDGLAMVCNITGNITIDNEKFSLENGTAFVSKTALNGSTQLISNFTMPKQTVSSTQIINSTYWQLYIPPNPAGNCSGVIVFSAETP